MNGETRTTVPSLTYIHTVQKTVDQTTLLVAWPTSLNELQPDFAEQVFRIHNATTLERGIVTHIYYRYHVRLTIAICTGIVASLTKCLVAPMSTGEGCKPEQKCSCAQAERKYFHLT